MSKGYKPRDKDRPPVQTIDVGGSGGEGGGEVEVKSWQFSLVDKTDYATLTKVGMSVTGVANSFDIEVKSNLGILGYAPKNVASEIIETMNGKGKLVGSVISVNVASKPSDTDVWVRLTLK